MQTDRQMYLALRNLMEAFQIDGTNESAVVYQAAYDACEQFELELGPLPDWADSHNIAQVPVQYAQLFTRDGRRCGNALISEVTVPPSADCEIYFHIITDMGNEMRLNIRELEEMFEIGNYVNKPYGVELRQRQNWSRAMGELGPEE